MCTLPPSSAPLRNSASPASSETLPLTIALPSAFQGLVSLLVVLVDNVMVASLGDTVYAGVAQSNGATAFFIAVITGLVGGSSVLISQYWGKRDSKIV